MIEIYEKLKTKIVGRETEIKSILVALEMGKHILMAKTVHFKLPASTPISETLTCEDLGDIHRIILNHAMNLLPCPE